MVQPHPVPDVATSDARVPAHAGPGAIRTILWDWHGVLGLQGYWQRPTREQEALRRLGAFVYDDGSPMEEWMRGVPTVELGRRCGVDVDDDLLVEQLYAGWPGLSFMNLPLLSAMSQAFPDARHWVVTDNVDVFTPWIGNQPWFAEWFDGVTNSADHGVRKQDGLFPIALAAAGASADTSLFLDDSEHNCAAFRALGGRAITVPRWSPTPD